MRRGKELEFCRLVFSKMFLFKGKKKKRRREAGEARGRDNKPQTRQGKLEGRKYEHLRAKTNHQAHQSPCGSWGSPTSLQGMLYPNPSWSAMSSFREMARDCSPRSTPRGMVAMSHAAALLQGQVPTGQAVKAACLLASQLSQEALEVFIPE